ncbi:hypothetical protein XCR1_1360007 [Xenorhabdus cabanillasii JM26]|uniref:Uncharacterized protein n=1 Tax=Xenorhabdus cabanillasii JM26 TaxID=1427517 RepID=W1INT6_9GAMM|nr:hypothetical protein XCR1_1360007 [Xenorhabdus cabanillasii JM26]
MPWRAVRQICNLDGLDQHKAEHYQYRYSPNEKEQLHQDKERYYLHGNSQFLFPMVFSQVLVHQTPRS